MLVCPHTILVLYIKDILKSCELGRILEADFIVEVGFPLGVLDLIIVIVYLVIEFWVEAHC